MGEEASMPRAAAAAVAAVNELSGSVSLDLLFEVSNASGPSSLPISSSEVGGDPLRGEKRLLSSVAWLEDTDVRKVDVEGADSDAMEGVDDWTVS